MITYSQANFNGINGKMNLKRSNLRLIMLTFVGVIILHLNDSRQDQKRRPRRQTERQK